MSYIWFGVASSPAYYCHISTFTHDHISVSAAFDNNWRHCSKDLINKFNSAQVAAMYKYCVIYLLLVNTLFWIALVLNKANKRGQGNFRGLQNQTRPNTAKFLLVLSSDGSQIKTDYTDPLHRIKNLRFTVEIIDLQHRDEWGLDLKPFECDIFPDLPVLI